MQRLRAAKATLEMILQSGEQVSHEHFVPVSIGATGKAACFHRLVVTLSDNAKPNWKDVARAIHERRMAERGQSRQTEPRPERETSQDVRVDAKLLRDAAEATGIQEPGELVRFALSLLLQPDPSGDVMRAARGSMPGLELDY
jgi:hypothetical protein